MIGSTLQFTPPAPMKIATRPVASSSLLGMGEAFDAAKRNGYKGWWWFPSLDPEAQMPEQTREVIAEKLSWLYNNVPAVSAVIDGLAMDEVDTGLWPKPATSSSAFNSAVKAAFQQQCGFHKSFSADGEDNFFSGQYRVRREIRKMGELFGAKLRAGEAATCPQLHFLPSWQCANASTKLDQSFWKEGRMNNKFGRAMKFRFLKNRERTQWDDLDAADVIHFHDPFFTGQKRGISELAPAVRQLFKLDEIGKAETTGVLLRARMAYAIERGEGDNEAPSLLPGAREVSTITNPDGTKVLIQKIMVDDDTEVEVADLSGGKKIKVVESAKSSESASWIDQLLANFARCTKYPDAYIFNMSGLTQGTAVRMAETKVQCVVNTVRDFQIILQYIDEWYPFWLWQNIQSGTFDNVRDGIPDLWWPYHVVRPKDKTVDPGRVGRLYDERVRGGLMPVGLYTGMIYGEDEEEFDDKIIHDAYRRRRRIVEIAADLKVSPLAYEEIFRPPPGTAALAPAAETPPDDDPDDTPPASPKK